MSGRPSPSMSRNMTLNPQSLGGAATGLPSSSRKLAAVEIKEVAFALLNDLNQSALGSQGVESVRRRDHHFAVHRPGFHLETRNVLIGVGSVISHIQVQ